VYEKNIITINYRTRLIFRGSNKQLRRCKVGCSVSVLFISFRKFVPVFQFNNNDDPEYFAYECLTVASVEKIFNDSIETLKTSLGFSHGKLQTNLGKHQVVRKWQEVVFSVMIIN
jgi:hypothetical protein